MESLDGQLLIASPFLGDNNFNKSVVLIVQHDQQGAFGIVLNRPTSTRSGDVWDEVSEEPCPCDLPIHQGGPIEGPLMALHTLPHFSDNGVLTGVHFTASQDNLMQIIRRADAPLHLFRGYSGWGPSQLEIELEEGAWLTRTATYDHIFGHGHNELWKQVAKEINDEIVVNRLDIRHIPNDPSLN